MYTRGIVAYDIIHDARGKDYEAEAVKVGKAIRRRRRSARTLLDVGCGTGGHLRWLVRDFECEGVDISRPMLARAREVLPSVPLHAGDMRTFDLGRRFDAVVCLFSAIGYLIPKREMERGVANMARHLALGGVLVIEPWIHPDNWHAGTVFADSASEDDIAVSRVSRSWSEGRISKFDFHYVIATAAGVEKFVEHHEMGLYTPAEYRTALEKAGLTVHHDPKGLIGRGLFIGVSPKDGR